MAQTFLFVHWLFISSSITARGRWGKSFTVEKSMNLWQYKFSL